MAVTDDRWDRVQDSSEVPFVPSLAKTQAVERLRKLGGVRDGNAPDYVAEGAYTARRDAWCMPYSFALCITRVRGTSSADAGRYPNP